VFLGGDVHAAMAARIQADPANPDSPVVASEIVATSITSQGFASMIAGIAKENPHILYAESQVRGYSLIELDRSKLVGAHRGVETVKRADAKVSTVASLNIDSGRPGMIRS
jgi:alkaline phosphatase D